MIILAIIALSAIVFVYLMRVLADLPVIPLGFLTYIEQVMPFIASGIKFVNTFTYAGVVIPLALVMVALHTFWVGYRVVMWIIKKIPMLGVDD